MKYAALSIILVQTIVSNIYSMDRLTTAITNQNKAQLEAQLQVHDVTQEQKLQLQKIAKEAVQQQADTLQLCSSKADIANIIFGTASAAIGVGLIGLAALATSNISSASLQESDKSVSVLILAIPMGIIGIFATKFGVRKIQNGWNLTSAQTSLQNARDILQIVNSIKTSN